MCERIAPYVQLDTNLIKLASNSIQERYDLISSSLQAPRKTPKLTLMKKALSLFNWKCNGKPQDGARKDVQYGWASGPIVDSFTGAMVVAGSTIRTPGRYQDDESKGVGIGKTHEMIHPSVQYRMQKIPNYRPAALKGFIRQQTVNGFEWRKGDITIPEFVIKPEDKFSRYLVDQEKLEGNAEAADFIEAIDQALQLKA
jgi:hypothetical protein